jgi:DNA phosphorothioation-associated putative methyltransferase
LLKDSGLIGTRQAWEKLLKAYHLEFIGHRLACPREQNRVVTIARHRAAITRSRLSRPVRTALEAGILQPESTSFFDYGCGYGGDVERLREQGYICAGWDSYYATEQPLTEADVVNLGYVINVIEDLGERREALVRAWGLTRQVLLVAAQVLMSDGSEGWLAYGDGVITSRNTFQKYYEQEELKVYIDQVLEVDAIPLALGIYAVFRNSEQAQAFRLSRFRSRATTPRIQRQVKSFADYAALLEPVMQFFTERGRLPAKGELETEEALRAEFGSFKQAFKVILQVTSQEDWDAIAYQRSQELLLYFALSYFKQRPKMRDLSRAVQEDIKEFFGTYQDLCYEVARKLLKLRDLEGLAEYSQGISLGIKNKKSLMIHRSALQDLPLLLRLYEGCASRTVGRLEEANIIKISFKVPKVSYFYYPDFDENLHPTLQRQMDVYLSPLNVRYQEFLPNENLPILHTKEQLVSENYPLYEKFARLTQQEKDWGLLDDLSKIQRLQGWQACLRSHCACLHGHRLTWYKDADPYQVKLQKSRIKARRKS